MIEVRINGYECDPGEIEIGTAGSYGVQQLHFAFSSEWEGLTRRTTWMTDAGKIAVLLDESDTMTVPAEATATAGRRWLSVDGVAAGKQMISVRMGYKVYETVEPGGENSVTPTDEEMTQALAILEKVKALKTPEITVGKTETVEAGTPARVENTGTATKAVLDFEIPRGESGVYVGVVEPDETAKVWVDPEGENDAEGAVIDLNAAVQEAREAAEEAGRAVESAASAKESATSAKESADAAKSSASGAGGALTNSVRAMKRAAAYAEGGTAPATLIGNVSYPAIDTIGAKGYMEQAQEAADRAEGAAERAEAAGGSGSGGGEGTPGGYYTPTVSQPDANTMRVSYTPSQEGMPEAEQVDIVLPQGSPGSNGKTAYQYAQDGGYTGSETEFAAKLAAEHLPVPATAAVGQYFKAKTVDENGLVTEVEAVDAPTGGGVPSTEGGNWKLLADVTINETSAPDGVHIIEITEVNGQELSTMGLTELSFCGWATQKGSNSYSYGVVELNGISITVGQNFGLAANARRFFSGRVEMLGGGMFRATFSSSNIPNSNVYFGAVAINQNSGGPNIPDVVTNAGDNVVKFTVKHANSAGVISEARLVLFGR